MRARFRFPEKKARILHAFSLAISVLAIGAPIVLYAQALNLGVADQLLEPRMALLYILLLLLILLMQTSIRMLTHTVLEVDEEGLLLWNPIQRRRIRYDEIVWVRIVRRRRDFFVHLRSSARGLSFYTYMRPIPSTAERAAVGPPGDLPPAGPGNPLLAEVLETVHQQAAGARWQGVSLELVTDSLRGRGDKPGAED